MLASIGQVTLKNKDRLDKIVREAGGIVGKKKPGRPMTNQVLEITKNPMHPLYEECNCRQIERRGRYGTLMARTASHSNSFLPKSITLFIGKYKRVTLDKTCVKITIRPTEN